MTYSVAFTARAAKQLGALPRNVRQTVARVIETLAANPRPAGAVHLKGTGFLRVRVRDYRIIYEVRDETLVVVVIRVGNRRDVYKNL